MRPHSSDVSGAILTLQTVRIQQLLALLVALDPALGATHALAGDPPQQPLTLVAVGGRGGGPHLEVMWRSAGNGVDERLKGLLVHMVLLQRREFVSMCEIPDLKDVEEHEGQTAQGRDQPHEMFKHLYC